MGLEPVLRTGDNLIETGCLLTVLQIRLTLLFPHPEDGIIGVAIDHLVLDAPLPHQRQGMDDGKKLTYIISTEDRSEVEDALYSIFPGLPEQPASTAQALAFTSGGNGSTVS